MRKRTYQQHVYCAFTAIFISCGTCLPDDNDLLDSGGNILYFDANDEDVEQCDVCFSDIPVSRFDGGVNTDVIVIDVQVETDASSVDHLIAMMVTAGGNHTCALIENGSAKCWGSNSSGEISGNYSNLPELLPVEVSGLDMDIGNISAGMSHTCAVTVDFLGLCWGGNYYGQIGDGTLINATSPKVLAGITEGIIEIKAGEKHSCALTLSNEMYCWGFNQFGQLGDGTTEDRYFPTKVVGLPEGAKQIAIGEHHTCAITTEDNVKCWGTNWGSTLGDGTTDDSYSPVSVIGVYQNAISIDAGIYHTCAILSTGKVLCWGPEYYGSRGNGMTSVETIPEFVVGIESGAISVDSGSFFACARMTYGAPKCWGNNAGGQLGDGTIEQRDTPVDVTGNVNGIVSITGGAVHTCALHLGGRISCWGWNEYGQLGCGTLDNKSQPEFVSGF